MNGIPRDPDDLRRVPRKRDVAVLVWMFGVIAIGAIAGLVALAVFLGR